MPCFGRAGRLGAGRLGWRPFRLDWRPIRLGWRPIRLGWRPIRLGWRPVRLGWRPVRLGWRPSRLGWRPVRLGWRAIRLGWRPVRLGWRPIRLPTLCLPLPRGNGNAARNSIFGTENLRPKMPFAAVSENPPGPQSDFGSAGRVCFGRACGLSGGSASQRARGPVTATSSRHGQEEVRVRSSGFWRGPPPRRLLPGAVANRLLATASGRSRPGRWDSELRARTSS